MEHAYCDNKHTQVNDVSRQCGSCTGTVAGGAQVLKESVAGLVGYNQAGDTSEQIAALDEQDAASTNPAVVSESAASGAKAPVAYESEGADPKTAGGGPYPQSGTRNEAGPVVQEKPEVSPVKIDLVCTSLSDLKLQLEAELYYNSALCCHWCPV